jgi:hypothetical protein
VAGSQQSVHVTAAVKAAATPVHAMTMRLQAIVVQLRIAHLPPAAKTAATPVHLLAITVRKRVVVAIIKAP